MKEELQKHGNLGLWGTVFAIMSTIIGGGMLSLPWAFFQSGIYFAIIFSIFASI
jgi:amino acid permease